MAIQFFADIVDNFLTDETHEIAFAKVEEPAQQKQQDQKERRWREQLQHISPDQDAERNAELHLAHQNVAHHLLSPLTISATKKASRRLAFSTLGVHLLATNGFDFQLVAFFRLNQ